MNESSIYTVPMSLNSYLEQGDTPLKLRDENATKTLKRRSANIDLQKSIQLLDDAVAPPSFGRLSRNPRTAHDVSIYGPRFMKNSPLNASNQQRNFTNTKISPLEKSRQFEISRVLDDEMTLGVDITEDMTQINMSLLSAPDPGVKVSEGLFDLFGNIQKSKSAPHQVIDLLLEYESACADKISNIKKISKGITRSQTRFKQAADVFDNLKNERETWQLLASLYKDRLETEAKEDFEMMTEDTNSKAAVWALSEQNIANKLFDTNADVRQSQLVIDWLESCALDMLETFQNNAAFFVDQPVSWENTLHWLQKNEQGVKFNTNRPIVLEIDPDAPLRQNRYLDDLDQEDEQRLLHTMYMCVRAGQVDKAQEICVSYGQSWRAATLQGWRLLHDRNYTNTSQGDAQAAVVVGNEFRDVWKCVCWRMASEVALDRHERAIYAALSGNLKALLPVCCSWMDYLWAYYKVMVDVKVEKELRFYHKKTRAVDDVPSEYWEKTLEPFDIFGEISASDNEAIKQQSQLFHHVIQKHVILGDIDALIEVMYSWIQKEKPSHLLRFMAHVVLFFRSIGKVVKEDLCEAILEAYVEDLINEKHKHLIAQYVATLNPQAQIHWYATFLQGISDKDERQQCLIWAEEEGLDTAEITKCVVERVRAIKSNAQLPSLAPDLNITEDDQAKIDAIDWLIFDENQRPESLRQANALMRSFIVVKKHVAARQVFDKLPTDSVDVVVRLWLVKTGSTELPPSDSNAIREYMCMKAYLDAVESFSDWFDLFHKGQPVKPASVEGDSFTDRVALEHRMKQYNLEHDRWMHNLLLQTHTTRDRIYNVLLFADGGWMVDTVDDPVEDESRLHEMKQLRKLHIPALCLNLHTVLDSSGLYYEAIQMADVVASDWHKLYQEFSKDALQHLLQQIAKSSHNLLYENKDPLGYELV